MRKDKIDPRWANYYVGIPFLDKGRDENGCDCWGTVRLVMQEQCNIILPSFTESYKHTGNMLSISRKILMESLSGDWVPVLRGQEKPFDVILARMHGQYMHVGIVVKKGLMLHTVEGQDTVTVEYNKGEWRVPGKIKGIYRHKELCKN